MTTTRRARLAALAPVVVLGLYFLASVRAGLPALAVVRAGMAVLLTQVLPGTLVWRAVRPRAGWWVEDVLLGAAFGAALAIGVQAVAGSLHLPVLSTVVGPAVAIVLVAVPATRRRLRDVETRPLPTFWAPSVGLITLLLIVPTQAFYRTVPFQWTQGFRVTYVDMPFHLALSAQLAHRGPASVPYVAGEPLLYHWFSHAWVAQVAAAGQVELDAVLFRFLPPLITVALVTAIAIAAVRISGHFVAGPVAALVAVAAGDVSPVRPALRGSLVNHLSPSLGLSSLLLVALLVVLVLRWRGQLPTWTWTLVPMLGVAAAGTKGSALPVVAAGASLAAAVGFVRGWTARRTVALDAALLMGSLLFTLVLVFGGGAQELRLDPTAAVGSAGVTRFLVPDEGGQLSAPVVGFGLLLLVAGTMVRGIGVLGTLAVPRPRLEPAVPLLLGVGLAGACAVALLAHDGNSQSYFLRNAAPGMAIGTGYGLAAVQSALGRRWPRVVATGVMAGIVLILFLDRLLPRLFTTATPAVAVLGLLAMGIGVLVASTVAGRSGCGAGGARSPRFGAAAVALLTVSIVPVAVSHLRTPLPSPAATVGDQAPGAFSADQIRAARWLRDHSDESARVITNRHCRNLAADRCDSRRFHVAAYTERQVLVEGWAYTVSALEQELGGLDDAYAPFWDAELLALNDRFISTPNANDAERLRDLGVRWVFVDKTAEYGDGLASYATPRLETDWAWVLEFAPAREESPG